MEASKKITFQQCFDKLKELKKAGAFSEKSEHFQHLSEIVQILNSFGVDILPQPQDSNRFTLWRSETKKLQSSYKKVLNCARRKKKLSGIFFNSQNYEHFCAVKIHNCGSQDKEPSEVTE